MVHAILNLYYNTDDGIDEMSILCRMQFQLVGEILLISHRLWLLLDIRRWDVYPMTIPFIHHYCTMEVSFLIFLLMFIIFKSWQHICYINFNKKCLTRNYVCLVVCRNTEFCCENFHNILVESIANVSCWVVCSQLVCQQRT